jgi:UDP-glucuronate 4-epimerase
VGSGVAVTVSGLVALLAGALGAEPEMIEEPAAVGDVRRTLADLDKARTVLGYRPRVPIEQGIPAFVDWFKGYHGSESRATG